MGFILNLNTKIQNPYSTPAVNTAVSILERDIKKTLDTIADAENTILLCRNESLCPETYEIHVVNDYQLLIKAGDDLGFVYALLSISEKYLGIRPFWFWLDQKIEKIGSVEIPCEMFCSPIPAVRFRGWFLNDEVLLIH